MTFSPFPKAHKSAQAKDPIAQMMAGFTGFAVAVTLILVTAIPVKADRKADPCATPAPCTLQLD